MNYLKRRTMMLKIIVCISIVLIIILGALLHKTGKPYNTVLLAFHKIITLGSIVLMVIMIVNYAKQFGVKTMLMVLIICTIVSLVALIISGALMSANRPVSYMEVTHKIATYIFLASAGSGFYMILK